MSWIYDSGASTLHDLPSDMRMIAVDNSGGGIFRFVKSTSSLPEEILEKYFCVENIPDIAAIACAYGIETFEAMNMEELIDGVDWLNMNSDFPRLLIVKTPAEESAEVLKSYFEKFKTKK